MITFKWQRVVVLLAFLVPSASVQAVPQYPPLHDTYVNDTASILSPEVQSSLRRDLRNFHDRTGKHLMVITIPSIRLYSESDTFESFATKLFNHRGIGDARRNDGIMVLVAPQDRKVRIELGRGYDRSYDSKMQNIINNQMLPEFRQGRLSGGIQNGVQAVIREFTPIPLPNLIVGSLLFIMAGGSGLYSVYLFWVMRKPKCDRCNSKKLNQLQVSQKDRYLTPAQLVEDAIGSVKHLIFQCQDCGNIVVVHRNQLFSGYEKCPSCKNKTLSVSSRTVVPATTYSQGEREITSKCHFCAYESVRTEIIPMISSSSDDSFSSSSSWSDSSSSDSGGGSSSGGGASGSW